MADVRFVLKSFRALLFLVALGWSFSAPGFAQTAEGYRRQAIELSRQKSWDEAIVFYRKALELAPNDPDTHYNLALTLKYKGDAKPAIDEFETALRLKPNWPEARYGLGATYYDLHDQQAALKELHTAVKLNQANAPVHRLLARIYAEQSDFLAGEAELRRALAIKPSAELHFELGLAEGQLGNLEAAAAQFRSAIGMNSAYAPAHSMLGVTLRRQGDHNGALAEFRKAADLDPKDPETQYNLGMELKAGDDLVGAIAALREAITLKPDLEKARYNLSIALRAQGQAGPAQKEMEDLKGLQEFRARLAQAKLLILKGVEALKKEQFTEALGMFQKAVEKSPELPTGHYYLGVALERTGDVASAVRAYEKAIGLKPD